MEAHKRKVLKSSKKISKKDQCIHAHVSKVWFRCSIHSIENINVTQVDECIMLTKCRVGIMSEDNKIICQSVYVI